MTASRRNIGTLPALMVAWQRAKAAARPREPNPALDALLMAFDDVARQQEEFNRRIWDSRESLPSYHADTHKGGEDSVSGRDDPELVQAGTTADRGTPQDGYTPIGHVHPAETATAVGLANASTEGDSSALARANHTHKRDVRVQKDGSDVGTRNILDFEGMEVTDDAGGDRVEVRPSWVRHFLLIGGA